MDACAASSREPRRNVSSSSQAGKRTVTTLPAATSSCSASGAPIIEYSSRCLSWRTRASFLPCSSRAAW